MRLTILSAASGAASRASLALGQRAASTDFDVLSGRVCNGAPPRGPRCGARPACAGLPARGYPRRSAILPAAPAWIAARGGDPSSDPDDRWAISPKPPEPT
jgi:hypothetical protein